MSISKKNDIYFVIISIMFRYKIGDVLRHARFGQADWVVVKQITRKGGIAQGFDVYPDRHMIVCLQLIDNQIIDIPELMFDENDIYPPIKPVRQVEIKTGGTQPAPPWAVP